MTETRIHPSWEKVGVRKQRRHNMARYEDVSEDPAIVEAIINIQSAIRVIAPLWEDMQRYGHGAADDLAGAQSDLEQAVRFLKGEEEPS